MAIFVDERTRVVVQGLTGREGSFHARRNRAAGTQVVAGVTPGKGGQEVDGVPVYDTVEQAVRATAANASVIFVPARVAPDAILEAADAGLPLVVCITEGIPALDMARVIAQLERTGKSALIGPNCPGVISPGRCNIGIIPAEICMPGPVGIVSRSGTLTYEVIFQLTRAGIGQSTCIGIGGDPIPGTRFVDCLARFDDDPETGAVVLIGEIGGEEEERAAELIAEGFRTPVVAYIAGFTAPPGRRMGHAGAIISGTKGTADAKAQALEAVGVAVARTPPAVAELVARALS
ncbi:MAG: succinate--CoA ligase subunit alpha [Actinomycetota bacterium]